MNSMGPSLGGGGWGVGLIIDRGLDNLRNGMFAMTKEMILGQAINATRARILVDLLQGHSAFLSVPVGRVNCPAFVP